ncbi:Transcriptional regulator [Lactococcus lactis subsp. lactis NCDO 2118]|uniref:Transcriptional regulator n=1 Tax=Lactococcus lactis subsp. lactis NCDO 2118 TaxID=1117941 RepID=A0ABC8A910_LACLL|nr:TetR/AcrR family transcriptional regulator [Lactococcus lactis]AII13820.1 Transcriptional regulator [Lactococcus lactis subsp. lactis NCDO 2118]
MKRKEQYQDFHDFIIEGMMLCLEKYTINELPLTEVCKKAGVSRMTFYQHFKNKEEVVLEYFELIYDKFLKELLELESINSLILSEKLVGLFVEQEEEIEKAVKGNYYSLIFQVFAQKMTIFYNETTTWADYLGTKQKFWNDFMAAGLFYVLGNWVKKGCQDSYDEVVKMVVEFHE